MFKCCLIADTVIFGSPSPGACSLYISPISSKLYFTGSPANCINIACVRPFIFSRFTFPKYPPTRQSSPSAAYSRAFLSSTRSLFIAFGNFTNPCICSFKHCLNISACTSFTDANPYFRAVFTSIRLQSLSHPAARAIRCTSVGTNSCISLNRVKSPALTSTIILNSFFTPSSFRFNSSAARFSTHKAASTPLQITLFTSSLYFAAIPSKCTNTSRPSLWCGQQNISPVRWPDKARFK